MMSSGPGGISVDHAVWHIQEKHPVWAFLIPDSVLRSFVKLSQEIIRKDLAQQAESNKMMAEYLKAQAEGKTT